MDNYRFEDVRVVLGEANASLRSEIKATLNRAGFRNVSDTGHGRTVRQAVATDAVDLLICDSHLADVDVTDLTFRIRHHEIGNNPFVVIVVLCADANRAMVSGIIDSGADDLLLKPLSVGFLHDRLMGLVMSRKMFMVTSSYIGPDRPYLAQRFPQEPRRMAVPNPIKARAVGGAERDGLQTAIDNAARELNERKMERHAHQIRDLVDAIMPFYESPSVDPGVQPYLERLQYVSEDISRRLKGTRYAHVGELCLTLLNVVTRLASDPLDGDSKDVRLLPKLSQAIKRAFSPDERQAAEIARDISRTVQEW